VGFGRKEALLPYLKTTFDGYRLLQEYFAFPEKFLFVEFFGFPPLAELGSQKEFEIACRFTRELPAWKLSPENLRLYCTPAVNLFASESHPLRVTHERTEYRVQMAFKHMEIFSVDSVKAWTTEDLIETKYLRFDSFQHHSESTVRGYYRTESRPSVTGEGLDTYASFVVLEPASLVPPEETVVFGLTCANASVTEKLRMGDIHLATDSSPEFAHFQNISRVSPPIRPPGGGDLHWRLISHLALNYTSLDNEVILRQLLSLYNWQTASDAQAAQANERRMSGLARVKSKSKDFVVTRTLDPQRRLAKWYGLPMRGTAVEMDLHGDHFAGEGDLFLFGAVLDEFFALYATVNSFTQLSVRETSRGEVYQWPPRLGEQVAL
jgi:type VI secretion system protein ImpG